MLAHRFRAATFFLLPDCKCLFFAGVLLGTQAVFEGLVDPGPPRHAAELSLDVEQAGLQLKELLVATAH